LRPSFLITLYKSTSALATDAQNTRYQKTQWTTPIRTRALQLPLLSARHFRLRYWRTSSPVCERPFTCRHVNCAYGRDQSKPIHYQKHRDTAEVVHS